MINIVVGNNASGKTLFLHNKLLNLQNAVTNLCEFNYDRDNISVDKVNLLEEILEVEEIRITDSGLVVYDELKDYSPSCLSLFALLASVKGIIVLDEPDLQLRVQERCVMAGIFYVMFNTFDEAWLVTHDDGMLIIPEANFYGVERTYGTSDVKLVSLSAGEAYDRII